MWKVSIRTLGGKTVKNAVLRGLRYCSMENMTLFLYSHSSPNFIPIIQYAPKPYFYGLYIVKNEYIEFEGNQSTTNAIFVAWNPFSVRICPLFCATVWNYFSHSVPDGSYAPEIHLKYPFMGASWIYDTSICTSWSK